MDDAYAIGTPGEVFEATEEFLGGLRSIGLMANVAKFEVWSPVADLTDNQARLRLGIPLKDPGLPQGIAVAGAPVGDAAYQAEGAAKLGEKVAGD